MAEIKFDVGKNIIQTAEASGVPRFEAQDIVGRISYSVTAVPAAIPARFTRSNLEITWQPLFAFTMYADRDNGAALLVEKVDLQHSANFATHGAAQAFVEQTIAQFQKGKWKRYHDPVWDTLLTGRSSILDVNGQLQQSPMTIDPQFKLSAEEWPTFAAMNPTWRWVGDGILATLEVGLGAGYASRPLDYSMDLRFELLEARLQKDARNEARRLKEGDAKGWGSTAELAKNKKDRVLLLKQLEANAIKRGDSVVREP